MVEELTREKILELPAGKETDALVAELVMGWERVTVPKYPRERYPEHNWEAEGGTLVPPGNATAGFWVEGRGEFPCYSTDISAAFHAAMKTGLLKESRLGQIGDGWWVVPFLCDPTGAWVEDHENAIPGPGAPLAICRAALLTTLES